MNDGYSIFEQIPVVSIEDRLEDEQPLEDDNELDE